MREKEEERKEEREKRKEEKCATYRYNYLNNFERSEREENIQICISCTI
jgi:hypothetical protein